MKLLTLTLAVALTGLLACCKEKDPTTVGGDTATKEDGLSCTAGAGSARTRMATGGDAEEKPEDVKAVETEQQIKPGVSRLKAPDPAPPAKEGTAAETDDIPGASKAVEFEVKTKERDDATRAELEKILEKAPAPKP